MNRIYQGRVVNAELAMEGTEGRKDEEWVPLEDWEDALWGHHVVFQDAVNYYLVALAALADPERAPSRMIKDLRERVGAAWEHFPRGTAADARGLRESLAPWLGLSEGATVEDAYAVILEGNEAGADVLAACLQDSLDSLLEKSGSRKITREGNSVAPKFYSAVTDANFAGEHARKQLARIKLILTLHGLRQDDLSTFGALDLATLSKRKRKLSSKKDIRKKLVNFAKKLRSEGFLSSENESQLKKEIQELDDEDTIDIPIYEPGGQSREKQFGIPLLLLGKQLGFRSWLLEALKEVLKVPDSWEAELEKAERKARDKVDPLEAARGERGFIFRAFTALPAWDPASPGEPAWKEFDAAAFKEALKGLNQFNQKTKEREEAVANLRGQLAIMLGSSVPGWKPRKTETGEEESRPTPLDGALFKRARELERGLTADLSDTVLGDEHEERYGEAEHRWRDGEWRVSRASLRGLGPIADEWRKLHAEQGDDTRRGDLEAIVKAQQREGQRDRSIGSVPLFLRLCERRFWPLWLGRGGEDEEDGAGGGKPFLFEMVAFHGKRQELERAQEPINLTPAEPVHSRRLYMFSDLKDKLAKVIYSDGAEGAKLATCALARGGAGGVKKARARLHYSARRLLRDELQGRGASRWLQPMTKALGLGEPNGGGGRKFDAAMSLMPDYERPPESGRPARRRFLLNFPVDLDPSCIHAGLGKADRWAGQFHRYSEKNLHLHWPGTIKGKGAENPWWENPDVVAEGFTCLSVDLGQRTAGAYALLKVGCRDPRGGAEPTGRPVREVGHDGERSWYAEVLTTGMLRLPGEDRRERGGDGAVRTEAFGKAGRKALAEEWEAGKALAAELLAEEPEAWLGRGHEEKSLPEQNDALIALANRRLSRLGTFHRWSCFDPDRAEVAERRESLIERLSEELSHWRDAEVANWKALVDRGDFAAFREAAGKGFEALREALGGQLVALANRTVPLRGRSWQWRRREEGGDAGLYGELIDTGPQLDRRKAWIRGQRGLSLKRVEQLENLRRLFLRYNRSFDREAGERVKFGRQDRGRQSGEPCRLLLGKIDRMKEERVNQTAHLILAEGLGVRLKAHEIAEDERRERDIHGEYERMPGRAPVDFIVIENLDRYLASQGRAPSENSRLMKWAHRAVRDKIKMLAEEPFGIPVVEAAAAYSSRFSSKTGVAGARCEERTELDGWLRELFEKRAAGAEKPGQPRPEHYQALLKQFEELEGLNARRREAGKTPHCLLLPKPGGPLFLPLDAENPWQADSNAASNIGLRAVGAPEAAHLLHRVRAEREKKQDGVRIRPARQNAREKAAFAAKTEIRLTGAPSEKLEKAAKPNFFYYGGGYLRSDKGTLEANGTEVPVASGVALWARVNEEFAGRVLAVNNLRLKKWERKAEEEAGDDLF